MISKFNSTFTFHAIKVWSILAHPIGG